MADTTLEIALVDASGRAVELERVALDVVLFTDGRERYRFDAGDTKAGGVCSTNFQALEQNRRENQAFFLMDYNTSLAECDAIVGVSVVTPEEFERRLAAVTKWFPDNAPALRRRIADSTNAAVRADDQRFPIQIGAENRLQIVCTRFARVRAFRRVADLD
ncbi:MAG TPA: hypothetical protein VHC73_08160 [Vitreimonas sp.]|nr:hypothetical protein [Vitreimonas sp.]